MSDSEGSEAPSIFADYYDPTDRLKAPGQPESIPSNDGPLVLLDVISPAAWVLEFLRVVFNYDPLKEFNEWFAGDWVAYAKAGEAYKRIGECMIDIGSNIHDGEKDLHLAWEGNAAEQARDYFHSLGVVLNNKNIEMSGLQEQYDTAARAVWGTAEAVSGIIKLLFDLVAIAAIAAAGGTATSWTGGGAAVGYGVSAVASAGVLTQIGQISDKLSGLNAAIDAVAAVIEGAVANSGDLKLTPIPETPYRHPAVS